MIDHKPYFKPKHTCMEQGEFYSRYMKGELIVFIFYFLKVNLYFYYIGISSKKIIIVKDNYRFTFGKGSPFKV
jgi:hypothetical protein